MLKEKLHDFYELIEEAREQHGGAVPAITRAIIGKAFPETVDASEREGCDSMLHVGVKDAVSRYLRSIPDPRQRDFASLCEQFADYVRPLRSRAYMVPSSGEQLDVGKLIANPELLDEARRFMRQKGLECLAEADRLDDLYEQVLRWLARSAASGGAEA